MYIPRLLLLYAILAFAPAATATQYFANRGSVHTGWDGTDAEHHGTIEEVTNVVYKGATAIKVTQTFDASYKGRYHSEAYHLNGYHRGEQGFYGFAFRLPQDWQSSPAQSYNLAQFIADFTDTGCDDFMPTSMVWIVGDQLTTRVKQGKVCDQHNVEFRNLATVKSGVWHRVVIQANWQNDGSGFYKMWFDGAKVLEKLNLPTTIDDKREFQFRVGLYANGWHDDNGMKGTQAFRQVWFDQIGMGTTFGDADPDKWG